MLSDDVIITATVKRQVKISLILLYALFMALPPIIMTANISGYIRYCVTVHAMSHSMFGGCMRADFQEAVSCFLSQFKLCYTPKSKWKLYYSV